MDDFTLEPKIPDVVREIREQEKSVIRLRNRFISNMKHKVRLRKESVSSKEDES